jgi:hypothetical protein
MTATLICLLPLLAPQVRPHNASRQFQLKDLQVVQLSAAGRTFPAWVMDTTAKRSEGMMFLTEREVRPNEGMLFVFAETQPLSFWMRNTILPLDIAYLAPDGRVLNVGKGRPFDESPVPSAGRAKYVLELRQGVAKKWGIGPGTRVKIPSTVRAKD